MKQNSKMIFVLNYHFLFQWLTVINIAVIYNLIFVIGRSVFWELQSLSIISWFFLDYTCDFIYIIDIIVRIHEGKHDSSN